MEITDKEEQQLVSKLIKKYKEGNPLCLQYICAIYNEHIINGIINREYALVLCEQSNDNNKELFYKLIQVCSFINNLYQDRYIILDLSESNKNPNDYTGKGFPYFAFKENAGVFELGKFIADYWTIPLIPTSQLIQLEDKKFITTDERRYRHQLLASWAAIIAALIIGLSSPILMTKCSNTKINEDQFERIVKLVNCQADTITNNESTSKIINHHINGKTTNEKR